MDAVVFGAAPLSRTERLLRRIADLTKPLIVAADGGAATAFAFGCVPDVVLGDLDSIPAETLADVRERRIPVEVFPRDKDLIDGELALERAIEAGARRLLLLGFLGGPRLDMTLANISLLLRARSNNKVLADERNEVSLICGEGTQCWRAEPGELVSLVPLAGPVDGITTRGLRWPLMGARLALGETRGVSNEPVGDDPVTVTVRSGMLLVARHYST
ncbi:MAG: thiamine diphosphokinase [Chloroflexota bacterium]